jgi:glutathione S-transferase
MNELAKTAPPQSELALPGVVRVRAAGKPREIATVKQALSFVDRHVHPDLARLPRWTFARALLDEAAKTGKSRDVNAAFRQLKQALGNEKWLDQSP